MVNGPVYEIAADGRGDVAGKVAQRSIQPQAQLVRRLLGFVAGRLVEGQLHLTSGTHHLV
jgi:hypothetical protein